MKKSLSLWLIAIVFLGVLVGVVGGGLMGGLVGYYVVLNHSAANLPAPVAQLAAAKTNGQAPAVTNLTVNEDSAVIDTVKKVSPGVVTVINTLSASSGQTGRGANPFGPNPTNPNGPNPFNPNGPTNPGGSASPIAEGSGVIIDQQGHIVTNAHVVDGASQLTVVFADGSKQTAKLVGEDTVSDIAVLQVTGTMPAVVPFGDSSALQPGETVIAIGSPLGTYRGSVTVGVVSGLNRAVDGSSQENLIQTDAAINHGNSGGPLLNLAGQVVGINTLVVQNTNNGDLAEGLGFAIPSNTAVSVAQKLIAQGKVVYPFIGISYTQLTPEIAVAHNLNSQQGVLVEQVSAGSPAAKAGLQANDIITAIDNTKIDDTHSLRSILFQYKPGDNVTLTVQRGGQTLSVQITLTSRPDQTSAGAPG